MQVAEVAFGCDVEAFWLMPLSLTVASRAAEFSASSLAGSVP